MPAVAPQVFSGTASVATDSHTVSPPRRQFLFEHLEDSPAPAIVITWNGGGSWTIRPGVSLAMYLKGTVVGFTVATGAGTANWQAFAQD